MAELVLLLLALVALAFDTSTSLVFVFLAVGASAWKQRRLRAQLKELTDATTKQNDYLRREIVEVRRQIAAAADAKPAERPAQAPVAAVSEAKKPAAPTIVPPVAVTAVEAKPVVPPPPPPAPVAPPVVPTPPVTAKPPEVPKPAPAPIPPQPTILPPPPAAPVPQTPSVLPSTPAPPPSPAARLAAPGAIAPLRPSTPKPAPQPRMKSVFALEEALGTNWLNKLGVIILVLGVAFFGIYELGELGPLGKVGISCAAAVALLAGGIWLEKRERYRVFGRTGIGGGWALLFFTTYALNHVQAMRVLNSEITDLVLMLVVAGVMVAHTLRYNSQLVTGLAFLLGFTTVSLSHDDVYSLAAGAVLALGLVSIVVKRGWFELEVFGILSSYLNHLYWLYRLLGPDGAQGHAFPQYQASTGLLFFYWLVFRVSYVVRRIKSPSDEHVSTAAAVLNTVLLLGTMKFQSVNPELAYLALLIVGAAEFIFGQLPITRRRRPGFVILSVLGALLMVASVPFHYSGNNVAILWLVGAEAFLAAGIILSEVIFRRLGLLIGLLVGVHLAAVDFIPLMRLRSSSEALALAPGMMFALCAVVLYLNAVVAGRQWKQFFGSSPDLQLLTLHSYVGGFAAVCAAWALCSGDWTALAFAALMLPLAVLARGLESKHFQVQYGLIGMLTLLRAFFFNLHTESSAHVKMRLLTLPVLAAAFYLTARFGALRDDAEQRTFRGLLAAAGTLLVTLLIYYELSAPWVAVGWMAFAIVLALVSRWMAYRPLVWQANAVAIAAMVRTFTYNFSVEESWHGVSLRLLTVVVVAAGLYFISRKATLEETGRVPASAYLHTTAGTALLATLAWYEAPGGWVAPVWVAFALVLAAVDRRFELDELPWQAHALAALTLLRSVSVNLYVTDLWHGISVRLLSLAMVAVALYALSRLIRMPERWRAQDFHHIYSWAASTIVSLLLWYELQPLSVAVGWAVFGLVLFEYGLWRTIKQFRYQAYVAFAAAFGRIFFVNLTAGAPGELWGPRLYTILPLALIFFFVYAQLAGGDKAATRDLSLYCDVLLAYLGSGSLVAVLYFQFAGDWIVTAWAAAVVVLFAAALWLDRSIFLHQALLLTVGTCGRGVMHNLFGSSYFVGGDWTGRYFVLGSAIALLLATLPFAYCLRNRYGMSGRFKGLAAPVLRPEQMMFFLPIILLTLMLALKMRAGMVTVAWGIEGVLIVLLALAVNERSFRLTGLVLLLVCVAKVMALDMWGLAVRDRYLTLIILGAALLLVSFLYTRYRDTIRQFL